MTASEIIKQLESLMEQYGDLPLTTICDENEEDVENLVVVQPDPAFPDCYTESKLHIRVE